ncbi:hypothetical protein THAOC_09889 [Thalassiosira oceanica]|uniref:Uncharacterized protein n=1 Tax=Thalassiosira oceanica TaxID=159749 RepID=K0SVA9_THAOC|nr:hypothetical protein THAOC_09889 [Thalassiosira oceanica]|eukprot:EJK68899.1 hypothetical protein THAOC_09889 [Thalassiosira oceanica]
MTVSRVTTSSLLIPRVMFLPDDSSPRIASPRCYPAGSQLGEPVGRSNSKFVSLVRNRNPTLVVNPFPAPPLRPATHARVPWCYGCKCRHITFRVLANAVEFEKHPKYVLSSAAPDGSEIRPPKIVDLLARAYIKRSTNSSVTFYLMNMGPPELLYRNGRAILRLKQ